MLFSSPFKKYQKQLEEMYEKKARLLPGEGSKMVPGSEAEKLAKEIDTFIEGEYSEAVFNYYKDKKPNLIRIATDEEYTWEQAFPETFEDVSASLRHSLVGLIEGGGRYKLL
jgi:hypothetical protein